MTELRLEGLRLETFRNHRDVSIQPAGGLTVVVGPNAAGKTNLLEAIAVTASGDSFRPFSWPDLVLEGEASARVGLTGIRAGARFEASLEVGSTGAKTFSYNGTRRRPSEMAGKIPVVSFVPEDLSLSKGSSDVRRNALDALGRQLSSAYERIRKEYARIVRQRNTLLRTRADRNALDAWDARLAEVGAALEIQRARLLGRIAEEMVPAHERMGAREPLVVRLLPSWSEEQVSHEEVVALGRDGVRERLERRMAEVGEKERERGHSLAGPHRDDVVFVLEERQARTAASQGQHRTIALAWKAAEAAVVSQVTGVRPVLLLDDVMSELDRSRREALSSEMLGGAQAIVTTTNLDYFDEHTLSSAGVVQL